ncbi:MAG: phosphoesterase PA-phosphatase [Chloroflexi bacterium]|nr:MAG: phosphoesterase PA-phosphatase [Chloroflexota bacterium]
MGILGRESQRAAANRRARPFLLFAALSFSAFIALAAVIRRNHRLDADVRATMALQRMDHPLLARLMAAVSWFGFRQQSLVLPAGIILGFAVTGNRRDARYLAIAWLGSMLSYTTKLIVRRPRPNGEGINIVEADLRDSSFPSGHVLHYISFWGFFAYLSYIRLRPKPERLVPALGVGSAIALVGPSRVYLGHHWLTDVLGSYTLGSGFLTAMIGLHRRGARAAAPDAGAE